MLVYKKWRSHHVPSCVNAGRTVGQQSHMKKIQVVFFTYFGMWFRSDDKHPMQQMPH